MTSELLQALIVWVIIGAILGWLASQFMPGRGFGLIGNIVVGIIGAIVAGYLIPFLWSPLGSVLINAIINALIGAIILLLVVGAFKRA
jgi:uncharacterized membrane protein YeaQ/YmgE (transglycosylase-associated protein family)